MSTAPEDDRDFDAFYATDILPVLTTLEVDRKRIAGKLTMGFLVVLALCGVAFVVATTYVRETSISLMIASVVAFVLLLIMSWISRATTRTYVSAFKHQVIAAIVRYFDDTLRYSPEGRISMGDFRASNLFRQRIDRYDGEDYIQGTVGQTAIRVSEVHAEYKTTTTDSKGRTRTQWHTIFKGLYFIGDFNKHFSGTTLVLPDFAERLFGRLGKMLQGMNVGRSEDLVKLEDPEFEKQFVVYGDDQVESRYILTPSLMRRIVAFKEHTGHTLHLSFRHNNVYVAITSVRDMFEPRIFRTILDRDLIDGYLDDMTMAVGIVEELNLNTRIWTKT